MHMDKRTRIYLIAGAAALLCLWIFRKQASLLLRLGLGSALIAFLLCPFSDWISRKSGFSREAGILLAFLTLACVLGLTLVGLIPAFCQQVEQLIAQLPVFTSAIRAWVQQLVVRLQAHGLPISLSLPDFPWEQALDKLFPLLGSTANLAGSVAGVLTNLTLAFTLAFYLLRDREMLFLQTELLVPAAYRKAAVRMAHAVQSELSTYLRGQALISLVVGMLAALALMLIGVQGFLVLGLLVGLFNLIPYFGPILGGIPVVLMALTQGGIQRALLAVLSMVGIQQMDNLLISPRIMGSVTGLHPAVVLIAITLGGSFGGLPGMLLAVPCVLSLRALLRTRAAGLKHNIEQTEKYH